MHTHFGWDMASTFPVGAEGRDVGVDEASHCLLQQSMRIGVVWRVTACMPERVCIRDRHV